MNINDKECVVLSRNGVPQEWENRYGNRANFVNIFLLILLSFVLSGWQGGLIALCIAFSIEFVYMKIGQKKYTTIEKEFKSYLLSGCKPYLVYLVSDGLLGATYSIVADDKLSTVFAEVNADLSGSSFWPTIIFLSEENKIKLTSKRFTNPDKIRDFYVKNIAVLRSYNPTQENLAAISEVLQWQKDIEGEEETKQEKERVYKSLSKRGTK